MKKMHVIIAAYLLAHVAYFIASEIFFGTDIQIVTVTWIAVRGVGGIFYLSFQVSINGVY